jgi:cytochrome c-type biogenesis protein CcmH/NrfF
LQQRLRRRYSRKLTAAFFLFTVGLVAQDMTNYLTPGVARVGAKLACRCGGCKESMGQCPMLHCGSADPMRRRLYDMQARGMTDDAIVKQIVQEQGVIALAGQQPLEWIAWLMPPIALMLGFAVYTTWVRRHRPAPAAPLTAEEQAMLDRFRTQIDREVSDDAGARK